MNPCERCGKETLAHTMSMFNADLLCMECKEIERQHPLYKQAREAENDAIAAGDFNFPGIGLPPDLRKL